VALRAIFGFLVFVMFVIYPWYVSPYMESMITPLGSGSKHPGLKSKSS